MADDAGRAQDQGRRHRRKGQPTAETATLLAEYQTAMRDELRALLVDLRGSLPNPGLLDEPGADLSPVRPALKERIPMWDLAIKVARELGTEVDAGKPTGDEPEAVTPRRSRRRVDYG